MWAIYPEEEPPINENNLGEVWGGAFINTFNLGPEPIFSTPKPDLWSIKSAPLIVEAMSFGPATSECFIYFGEVRTFLAPLQRYKVLELPEQLFFVIPSNS